MLNTIRYLRALDLPLDEIAEFLHNRDIEVIEEKLERLKKEVSIESARENIFDIAGIRVVCNFIDDVYAIADMLTSQNDVTLITEKDYIKNPKPNGYRSLHLVISVPVYLLDGEEEVPVEIQLRTVAMDFWASLEHNLRYKKEKNIPPWKQPTMPISRPWSNMIRFASLKVPCPAITADAGKRRISNRSC